MKPRHYISGAILLVVVLVAGWVALRLLYPISVGTFQADFTQMPPDDKALQQWLASQAEIKKPTITRNNNSLTVAYKMPGWDARGFAKTMIQQLPNLGYQYKSSTVESKPDLFGSE